MRTLIAAGSAAATAVAAAAAIVVVSAHGSGSDPYAGAYPLVTPARTPTASPRATWRPSGRPAGPLSAFPGKGSRVVGRITDRTAGVSYARLGPPWKTLPHTDGHSSGEQGQGLRALLVRRRLRRPAGPTIRPAGTEPTAGRRLPDITTVIRSLRVLR